MKPLFYMTEPDGDVAAPGPDASRLEQHLATTPMKVEDVANAPLLDDDWLVLKTRLTGICGSDTKQVLMDFDDADDNPMTAFISFPQVLGHEVVATVDRVGPAVADRFDEGQRVVLNPWLSCGPRGITPVCAECAAGNYSACWNFLDGRLAPGIHSGNSSDATGGFAEYLPAHELMAIPIPDGISDEVAVLADPFSVSLHAIVRNPPPPHGRAVVYGAGALGTTATAILRALHPDVEVATVARWPAQAELAARLGATVFAPEPREELIENLASWSDAPLRRPWAGLPLVHPGHIDCVYDTVGAPETVEVALRVLAQRGTLVQLGVSSPARFEWTPWYFKELRLVGSNAFGVEEVDGVRLHAIEHYLRLVEEGRIDLTGMLTHRFRLD
jgi:threonine dehydrogenase-like Zn-dependent dehydrogenase